MPSRTRESTNTKWSHEFDTLRRENLFKNPPKDHSAYPLLEQAIAPHIESFNALFEPDGLIAKGILDIGTKYYLDGDERTGPAGKNVLSVKIKDVRVEKAVLPPSNKFSKNREIYPAECRERHVTYRGKMMATLQFRINGGDPFDFVRDLGQIPLMLKVCTVYVVVETPLANCKTVESLSLGKKLAGFAGTAERRSRGIRGLLCC